MKNAEDFKTSRPSWLEGRASAFTLIELLIIISILGLILSFGYGSFIRITRRERLRVSLIEANGFIEAVRRAAMSHSTRCDVSISAAGVLDASEVPSGSTNRCTPPILSGGQSSLDLQDNTSDPGLLVETNSVVIGFTSKGTSVSDQNAEITFTSDDADGFSYCLLISSPLGFTKTGSRELSASDCQYAKEIP